MTNGETHRAALTEIGRSLEVLGITVDELLRDPILYATVTACAYCGTTDIATVLVMMLRGVMTERDGYREGLQQMHANSVQPISVYLGGFPATCERCGEEYVRGGKVGLHGFTAPEEHACGGEGDDSADPLARKPHDWTRFEALWRDVCRAYDRLEGPYHSAKTHEEAQRNLETVREARTAFESSAAMAVRMHRGHHAVAALTPDEFVDRWSEGYR